MKTGDFIWFAVEVIFGALVFFFAAKNHSDSTKSSLLVVLTAAIAAIMYVGARSSYLNSEEYIYSGATGADQDLSRTIYKAQGIIMFLAGCAGVIAKHGFEKKSAPPETHSARYEMKNENLQTESKSQIVPSQGQSQYTSKQTQEAPSAAAQPSAASLNGFELLFKEQERGYRHEVLWLKSLSEADGNEAVALARYNRERAAILESQEIAIREREAQDRAKEEEENRNAKIEKEQKLKEFLSEVQSTILKAKSLSDQQWNWKLPSKETIQALKSKLEESIPNLRVEGFDEIVDSVKEAIGKVDKLLELHCKHKRILAEIVPAVRDKKRSFVRIKMQELSTRFADLDYQKGEQLIQRSEMFWLVLIPTGIFLSLIAVGIYFVYKPITPSLNHQVSVLEKTVNQSLSTITPISEPKSAIPLEKNQPPPLPELQEEVAAAINQMSSAPATLFSTADLPNALGLLVKGQLPPSWSVRHNPKPGGIIIAGTTSEKYAISVEAMASKDNENLVLNIEAGFAEKLIPPKATLINSKVCQVGGYTALQIEFTSSTVSHGLIGHIYNRFFWIVLKDRILGLHFIALEDPENQRSRFSILEPLFEKIVQSIKISQPHELQTSQGSTNEPKTQSAVSSKKTASSIDKFEPIKTITYENTLGMKFVRVVPGSLWVAIWETRNKDFDEYLFNIDQSLIGKAPTGSPIAKRNHPVVNVTFDEATEFCRWLSKKEHEIGTLPREFQYRLPTDSEWTTAVGKGVYPWGIRAAPPIGAGNYRGSESYRAKNDTFNVLADMGWSDSYPETSPVGSFNANELGIYDLGGNVWEWCDTEYDPIFNSQEYLEVFAFAKKKRTNSGSYQMVLRGASWRDSDPLTLNSSARLSQAPDLYNDNLGFRIVLAPAN